MDSVLITIVQRLDLRELATSTEDFEAVFAAGLTRKKIKAALAKGSSQTPDNTITIPSEDNTITIPSEDTQPPQPIKIGSPQELPEGKR